MNIKSLFVKTTWGGSSYLRAWVWAILWVGGILLFSGAIIAGGFWIDRFTCNQYADESGYEVTYRIPTGCYVDTGNGVVHRNQIIDNVGN